MTINLLQPVTLDEIQLVRSVFERLVAGAPIAAKIDAITWLDELEAGSPDVVEVAIAARRLKVSVDTVKRWCRADSTLGGKIKGRWRVSLRRLQRFRRGA